ncbi:MAG: XdhC family protein [Solirubrobacteraceae bacterium]
MLQGELASKAEGLARDRVPFVLATVVRARRPTSVHPGDAAIVSPDGTIDGFIGGVCAESSVRLHALRALETGEPLLLRLVPDDLAGDATGSDEDAIQGAIVERNPCLSGGALEVFLEPHLPSTRVVIVGGSPIAQALATLTRAAGYDAVRGAGTDRDRELAGAVAVIVASHGNAEEATLAAALSAGVPYVALVASPRRGAAVRSGLDLPGELRDQLHTPAGLDIGARTPAEIAVSILAELVARLRSDPVAERPAGFAQAPAPSVVAVATDPVCGMQVAITEQAPRLQRDGKTFYFCGDGCRNAYTATHAPTEGA